jgi:hypothetical protein
MSRTMTPADPPFTLVRVLPGNWMFDCGPIDPGAQGEFDPGAHIHGHVLADTWDEAIAQLSEIVSRWTIPAEAARPAGRATAGATGP